MKGVKQSAMDTLLPFSDGRADLMEGSVEDSMDEGSVEDPPFNQDEVSAAFKRAASRTMR